MREQTPKSKPMRCLFLDLPIRQTSAVWGCQFLEFLNVSRPHQHRRQTDHCPWSVHDHTVINRTWRSLWWLSSPDFFVARNTRCFIPENWSCQWHGSAWHCVQCLFCPSPCCTLWQYSGDQYRPVSGSSDDGGPALYRVNGALARHSFHRRSWLGAALGVNRSVACTNCR